MHWIAGFIGSVLIAAVAYRKHSLTASGALAAVAVGTLLYGFGSLAWFGTLIMFFISSSFLSKWRHRDKAVLEVAYAKTGRRDAMQVLANGGLAVIFCVVYYLWPSRIWWAAFIGILATVNADTWATEIGGLSRTPPRSIVTWRVVAAGTSGGLTSVGTAATLAGGLFIGTAAWLLIMLSPEQVQQGQVPASMQNFGVLLLTGGMAGLLGSLTDSLLGATGQVMYKCTVCGHTVERQVHCDRPTVRVRGIPFLNNDAVNFISSAVGGLIGGLLALVF